MNDIKPGDLVRVVYDPNDMQCDHVKHYIGYYLIVKELMSRNLQCDVCGRTWKNVAIGLCNLSVTTGLCLRLSWLRKVPPLSEPETDETPAEVTKERELVIVR